MSLLVEGVLLPDDFALVIHNLMMESSELKRWYAPLCKMVGSSVTMPTYVPSQEMELDEKDSECADTNYWCLPHDYIPPGTIFSIFVVKNMLQMLEQKHKYLLCSYKSTNLASVLTGNYGWRPPISRTTISRQFALGARPATLRCALNDQYMPYKY
jgi:hypothetical protein